MANWENLNENIWERETADGVEFIEIVWLDTCPYDENAEYCVCSATVSKDDLEEDETEYDYFSEHCLYDSFCIFGESNYNDALAFVMDRIGA